MKKTVIILLALAFIGSIAYAAETAVTEKPTIAEQAKTFVGKVVNVTVADPAKGITEGTVTVADETGKATTFTVKATAKILGHALDVITLDKLKIGDKIKIKEAGENEARSIKVVR